VQREDGSWLLDGLLAIDEFKDLLDLDSLPEEDRVGYQTLGGFVMSQIGSIPATGQHFEWADFRFEVMDMDGRRVDKILVTPIKPDTE
jgi:putative hemolysin